MRQRLKEHPWVAKLLRSVTSVLPIDARRRGACRHCGRCCMLGCRCVFLRFRPDGRSMCAINGFKPLSCRKYPRHAGDFPTCGACGYRFG